ncbi:thiol-disulfide oxidoreductase DCC family protein [Aestuariispira insulae]|uniref:Putative DCC family thiol-disulfide oxidoreductase YuxK n=1 Tax=Aestuariispira insulae TaxID=1461337 RepID=A0A3D9HAA5_9PROT|nr:DCC1-like thiol-disulfide oxidoreductase family protein [Aestuariispira insulae]RED46111.1 putative DCC family thiol-disulfide oxidoreductase YuxK [Aestuariispira insulae]
MTTERAPYSYRQDPDVPDFPDGKPIIIFDGHCAFCSDWARFVLKHDREGRFRLLAAQTDLGRALYVHYGLDPEHYETNILIENGMGWFKSEGSIRMAEGLGCPWSLAVIFRLLPLPARDWLYELIARNRFKLRGRLEQCLLPSEKEKARFLGL